MCAHNGKRGEARQPATFEQLEIERNCRETFRAADCLFSQVLHAELSGRILEHSLNPELGFEQPLARRAQPRHPFFEELEGTIELDVVRFELVDDGLEALEVGGEGVGNSGEW